MDPHLFRFSKVFKLYLDCFVRKKRALKAAGRPAIKNLRNCARCVVWGTHCSVPQITAGASGALNHFDIGICV